MFVRKLLNIELPFIFHVYILLRAQNFVHCNHTEKMIYLNITVATLLE